MALPCPLRWNHQQGLRRQATAGFSLIEVLVTLAIVGVASSLIVLTTRPADPARAEFQRLQQTVEAVSERARISGIPAGLRLSEDGYQPVTWQAGDWQPVPRQARTLPGGLTLSWTETRGSRRRGPQADDTPPQLVFDPLGHTPRTELTLSTRTSSQKLTISAAGIEVAGAPR